MTLTMNKNAARTLTAADALNAYYDEIALPEEIDWAEIEAWEMELAEAMDAALAELLDAMYWEEQVNDALAVARKSDDPRDWEVYSDLYKSVYGVRPR